MEPSRIELFPTPGTPFVTITSTIFVGGGGWGVGGGGDGFLVIIFLYNGPQDPVLILLRPLYYTLLPCQCSLGIEPYLKLPNPTFLVGSYYQPPIWSV